MEQPFSRAAAHASQLKRNPASRAAAVAGAAGDFSRQAGPAGNSIDNSPRQTAQVKKLQELFAPPIQRQEDEEELMQGKFPIQRMEEEEELMQGKFPIQEAAVDNAPAPGDGGGSGSGLPRGVQARMENALNTSLSDVTVHSNSGKASEVGALAYTQGTDIHVAPGQYNPGTSAGKQLLGHELAHVAQQKDGRVQPTGSVGGLPLNDSPALEKEADDLGSKAL
ncbi:MAG: DUF4157 domain-containing protein [bacterium]|nr:DUF4157 domain-containing protein [bacterium]